VDDLVARLVAKEHSGLGSAVRVIGFAKVFEFGRFWFSIEDENLLRDSVDVVEPDHGLSLWCFVKIFLAHRIDLG
jgi:hypothetical protein